jgi:hypothetical protein
MLFAQRMKLDLYAKVCQQKANVGVLLSQALCLIRVFALEDWQKMPLFGLEMLEELALETTPGRLAVGPISAMDVIAELLE